MNIYYWLPFIGKIGTIAAVVNSAISLQKYSKNNYQVTIINAVGEWSEHLDFFKKNNIKVITLNNSNIFKKLPRRGFFFSRLTYFYIFFSCFFRLKKLLHNNPPDIFVAHLITSLPLILNFFYSFKTKMVLKTSGLPKLTWIRKYLWKIVLKKIYFVTASTQGTISYLEKNKVVNKDKIFILNDAMLNCKKIQKLKFENLTNTSLEKGNFILGVGRLTKQKNFALLIKSFVEIIKKYNNLKLAILGEGEDRDDLNKLIQKNNLNNEVYLLGYQKNIFKFLKNCKCFIQSSLWEDPGFVSIEAGYCNTPVISSDCDHGPKELLLAGKAGFLFKSNSKRDLLNVFENFMNSSKSEIYKKAVYLKKNSKLFSMYSHYSQFNDILKSMKTK